MELIFILTFVLGCVGITMIFTLSKLFKPVRTLLIKVGVPAHWVICTMCIGFWVGGIGGFHYLDHRISVEIFLIAGSMSILSYSYWLLMKGYIDKHDR